MKNFITAIVLTFQFACSYGQEKTIELDTILINFKWIAFATSDTVFQATMFISEDGRFYFRRNFEDPDSIKKGIEFYAIDKKSTLQKTGNFLVMYNFVEGVDTIYSYTDNENYAPQEWIQIKNTTYLNDLLLEDVRLSYLFREFTKEVYSSSNDHDIILLYPKNDIGIVTEYSLLIFKNKGENFEIFYYSGNSEDLTGFNLKSKESTVVPVKKLKKILIDLEKADLNQKKYCLKPGNPSLLIIKNKPLVLSPYCMIENKEGFTPFLRLIFRIQSIKRKYFRN